MRQFSFRIPRTHRQLQLTALMLAVYLIFVATTVAFVKIADEVHEQETLPIDTMVLRGIHSLSTPFLDTVIPTVTDIGGPLGTVLITCGIAGLLLCRRQMRRALLIFLSVGGAAALNMILKAIFERPRPDLWDRLVVEHSYSFPSGHAMASAALGLALIAALWTSRYRWAAIVVGGLYMTVISATRLYLGVHYPSDVIAGWLVSAAWVAIVVASLYTRLGKSVVRKKLDT